MLDANVRLQAVMLLARATMLALAILVPQSVRAGDFAAGYYIYAQIGPTFGIVDDSFAGDYEDTVGVNGRIGWQRNSTAFELHVEGLPGSIVKRSKNSKSIGKDIVSTTANVKLFYDVGPFETYAVGGIGVVTLSVALLHTLGDESDDEIDDREIAFHARAGLGVQFPLVPHFYGFLEGAWNGGGDAIERYSYLSLTTGIGFRF